ncbi:MAG: Flp pilus assembly protein CpaB [Candidatus Omnitrophica bacterium]|nr:Flp pilus assembly protein CpaB [Candidatus Omnitrophota bacterium]
MQRQRLMLLIAAGVLASLAIALLNIYLNQQRQIYQQEAERRVAKKQESQTAILVANQDIPRGVTIDQEMLEVKIFPKEFVTPQAVSSLDRIAGMVTIAPISKGEQITLSKLTQSRQTAGLAEVTPVGKRAITISVDNISSLAGMIKPGDYVDVIATLSVPALTAEVKQTTQVVSIPLFQNILVLAVGQQTGIVTAMREKRYIEEKEGKKETSSSLITLALTPQEANFIAFIQEQQGKIRLVLRSPADSQTEPFKPVTWETLFQYLMPQETMPEKIPEKTEPVTYVEIYRGLKKETVPLTK